MTAGASYYGHQQLSMQSKLQITIVIIGLVQPRAPLNCKRENCMEIPTYHHCLWCDRIDVMVVAAMGVIVAVVWRDGAERWAPA